MGVVLCQGGEQILSQLSFIYDRVALSWNLTLEISKTNIVALDIVDTL